MSGTLGFGTVNTPPMFIGAVIGAVTAAKGLYDSKREKDKQDRAERRAKEEARKAENIETPKEQINKSVNQSLVPAGATSNVSLFSNPTALILVGGVFLISILLVARR